MGIWRVDNPSGLAYLCAKFASHASELQITNKGCLISAQTTRLIHQNTSASGSSCREHHAGSNQPDQCEHMMVLPPTLETVSERVSSCSGEVHVHHADGHADDQTERKEKRPHQVLLPGRAQVLHQVAALEETGQGQK